MLLMKEDHDTNADKCHSELVKKKKAKAKAKSKADFNILLRVYYSSC